MAEGRLQLPAWALGIIVTVLSGGVGLLVFQMRDVYREVEEHEKEPGHAVMLERVEALKKALDRIEVHQARHDKVLQALCIKTRSECPH